MKQRSSFRYDVSAGEVVRIVATPHGATGAVTIGEAGQDVEQASESPPTFEFEATNPAGQKHRTTVRGDFLHGDEEEASYVVSVSGSSGGGAFSVDSLDRPPNDDPDQFDQFTLTFKVEAP